MKLKFLPGFFLACSVITAGCKKSDSLSPISSQGSIDSANATIYSPQKINIYPAKTNNGNGPGRIFINTRLVGNVPVTIPMLFDTGSAGVVLNALSIFPTSMVDENGFKFKTGKDTINYNGITITKMNVQKTYGSATSIVTRKIGNLGYAKLSVGDESGAIKMLTMPILFYYQTTANNVITSNSLGSIFGVNTTYNDVVGMQDSSYKFNLVSPFKYLIYNNLTAGYKIGAVSLNGCEIATAGSCKPQPLLTVGLNQTDLSTFQLNSLAVLNPPTPITSPQGFPAYPNYTLYNPNIAGSVVSNAYRSRSVSVLLDSGTPGINLNVSQDSIQADNFPLITLTLPSKNTFVYNYKRADFATGFNRANNRSVYGVYFFTAFSFLEDYKNGVIGLKAK